jgi:hypothetical protein
LVHGLKIPLGGHFLSLNQGVLLTFAVRPSVDGSERIARRRGMFISTSVSFVTGLLKFLSPAGARLMPAIGISIQGVLYAIGIALFGMNIVGVSVGMVLLSVWAFLYPIVFGFLIFGQTLFDAVVKLWTELSGKLGVPVELGVWILVGAVAFKALVAIILAVFAWRADEAREARYFARVGEWAKKGDAAAHRRSTQTSTGTSLSPVVGATRDLLRPVFLVSLVLTVAFVLFAGRDAWTAIGYLARTVAIAWFIFFGVRAFPKAWAKKIQSRFPALAETAAEVRRSRS